MAAIVGTSTTCQFATRGKWRKTRAPRPECRFARADAEIPSLGLTKTRSVRNEAAAGAEKTASGRAAVASAIPIRIAPVKNLRGCAGATESGEPKFVFIFKFKSVVDDLSNLLAGFPEGSIGLKTEE